MNIASKQNEITLTEGSLAQMLKSAGDTLRLEILRILKVASFGVQELAFVFEMPQPGMSHHLKVLSRSGLVTSRREGNCFFYQRPTIQPENPLKVILESIYNTIDEIKIRDKVNERIETVYKSRSDRSMEFFSKNSTKFREEQGKIASYDQYSGALEDLLQHVDLNEDKTVLEIGPGEGELLMRLAPMVNKIYALDNSKEMLGNTKSLLGDKKFDHIEYVSGDLNEIIDRKISVDFLVLNMVLHHMASPPEMFELFSKTISHNGILMLIELCSHDQDWVRNNCGDLWLGFNPDELTIWAKENNFITGQSSFLGLKNGFQIQLRLFINR